MIESINQKEKVVALYDFIEDLCKLNTKTVCDIKAYSRSFFIKQDILELNDNVYISVEYRDRTKNDVEENIEDIETPIISVKKPFYEKCPKPPENIAKWLEDGWDDYTNNAKYIEKIKIENENSDNDAEQEKEEVWEFFNDDKNRAEVFDQWKKKRDVWVERQILTKKTRALYDKLYHLHFDLDQESESYELAIGNGFVKYAEDGILINHPLLLKRVITKLDAKNNIIAVYDTENSSELYTQMLMGLSGINASIFKNLEDELKDKDYHPLDRNDCYDWLKLITNRLSSKSKFIDEEGAYSDEEELLLQINPIIFVRKKIDGTVKTVQEIKKDIENGGSIPTHLMDLTAGGKIDIPEEENYNDIDKRLAATSGEDPEILLSKEANKEQLDIARRIEKFNAVLVQGPPGTGKTHTIANLLGHFLAQGKSVLVTSYKTKALAVLKDKVPEGVKNLCVAVLEENKQDMERSVDGISDYLSRHTSGELKHKIEELKINREAIINELSQTRRKIYALKNKEFESVVYDGNGYKPYQIAKFVFDNKDTLSYLPGDVKLRQEFPLTDEELMSLYKSNGEINQEEENELEFDIPNNETLISPVDFNILIDKYDNQEEKINSIKQELDTEIQCTNNEIYINKNGGFIPLIQNPEISKLDSITTILAQFEDIEEWILHVISEGKNGGGYKQKWLDLIEHIKDTVNFHDSFVRDTVGKTVEINNIENIDEILTTLTEIKEKYEQKNKLSFLDKILNQNYKIIEENIKINNSSIQSAKDCELVINTITLDRKRNDLACWWDELIAIHGVKKFKDLDEKIPENIAKNFIPKIEKYLDWHFKDYEDLQNALIEANIDKELIYEINELDNDIEKIRKILYFSKNKLSRYIEIAKATIEIQEIKEKLLEAKTEILSGSRKSSDLCNKMAQAISEHNKDEYKHIYFELSKLFQKYTLKHRRIELLEKLKYYAPQWEYEIENRNGIHGNICPPENIKEAWKWKQFKGIIEELLDEPYESHQKRCIETSKKLREETAKLCEARAWYYLLLRTEKNLDMKQALIGWKQVVKKIGKGTGQKAPYYRKEAKKLMKQCQNAVPAWIMSTNKALETLTPGENSFDVIIVDEASQSDITSLALLYMGKKLIIVGDDEQVTPVSVGKSDKQIQDIRDKRIKGVIKNDVLYDSSTSLYGLAETTFQPLMLREHFRCVPEIIGFSNDLSYHWKIKPLRASGSSNLLPAVVNYRVENGFRDINNKKFNLEETMHIISLIQACIEQEEYANSTFGIISLLGGEESAVYIRRKMLEYMEAEDIEKHKILCGNASHFQGDERDVIFLSMIDSCADGEGPLRCTTGEDANGSILKKSYNVAASRAKNQMWVVHSLESSRDLKEGDIRKKLLDYSSDYKSILLRHEEIKKKADSEFEAEVCQSLVSRGYNIEQQHKVGSYKIDMVAKYQNKKIAIECDGDKYHGSESQIMNDMERQTVLERIGWRFIRLRSSEYNYGKEQAIDKIVEALNDYGIYPENLNATDENTETSELFERVKIRAAQIREEWKNKTTDKEEIDEILKKTR